MGAHEVRGVAERALVRDANVRGELPADLVAKPQAELTGGQARTDLAFRNVLGRELEFRPRLQDEPLRQAEITVSDVAGDPGWYSVGLKVRPHFKYMGASFTLSLVGKLEKS